MGDSKPTLPGTPHRSDVSLLKRAEACAEQVITEEGGKQVREKDKEWYGAAHNAGSFSADSTESVQLIARPEGTIGVFVYAEDRPSLLRTLTNDHDRVSQFASISQNDQLNIGPTEVKGNNTNALTKKANAITKRFGACMVPKP